MNYLIYWFECFRISLKQSVEFKWNFYSAFILGVSHFMTMIVFGIVFGSLIGVELGWGFKEFILFSFLLNLLFDFSGLFFYGHLERLDVVIKNGNFNSYLTKPGNQFFMFLFKSRYNPTVFLILDIFMYSIFLSFLGDWSFFNIVIGVLILMILVLINVLLVYFLMSFTWILIELGNLLFEWYFNNVQNGLSNYPGQFFRSNSILFFMMGILPMFYVSTVLVPIISFGDFSVFDLINYWFLFGSIFVMCVWTFYNWRYGLKRYEAYG